MAAGERKSRAKTLVAKTAIRFSESFEETGGPERFARACGIMIEGVVSKVRDSHHPSGRGNDWVKKTCVQRETLPIAGFALKANKFEGLSRRCRATTWSMPARSMTDPINHRSPSCRRV
jgi:bifunctional non-homologous end joining protein LigD